jgi:hypothetical protein
MRSLIVLVLGLLATTASANNDLRGARNLAKRLFAEPGKNSLSKVKLKRAPAELQNAAGDRRLEDGVHTATRKGDLVVVETYGGKTHSTTFRSFKLVDGEAVQVSTLSDIKRERSDGNGGADFVSAIQQLRVPEPGRPMKQATVMTNNLVKGTAKVHRPVTPENP